MRRLVYFALGFGCACLVCAYVFAGKALFWVGLALLLLSFIPVALGSRREIRLLQKSGALLLGIAAGVLWFTLYSNLYLAPASALNEKTETVTIHVSDYSWEGKYGFVADGRIKLEGRPYRVRMYLDDQTEVTPGEELTGSFRFRFTAPRDDEEPSYQAGKGIFLLAYQKGTLNIQKGERSLLDIPAKLRRHLHGIVTSCFPEDAAAFAAALLLGDTSNLDYETDTTLKISGIRHIVAVSGLHVSILFALISVVCARNRVATAIVGFPCLVLFAALAGFSPSVSRASLMAGLMLLAMLMKREYDGMTALAFAAIVLLLCNPLSISSASFQLSVASVSGIFLFSDRIRQWIAGKFGSTKGKKIKHRLVMWCSGSVGVSLSSSVFVIPLCAGYFDVVSLISILTNLLTLWIVAFVFYGILAVCLFFPIWPGAGMIVGTIVSFPIRYILFVARLLAKFPVAAVYTCSPYIRMWLFFAYAVLALLLLCRGKIKTEAICCVTLGLCLSLLVSWIEPMLDDVRCTVLDVGQGQCILLQSGGRNYIVDCGGDGDQTTANIAAQELLSQGVSRLDGLILTHFDQDHVGGAPFLLSRIKTDVVVLPAAAYEEGFYQAKNPVIANQDLVFDDGKSQLYVFAPDFSESDNESSLCVLFDTEKCDILITGDQPQRGERRLITSHTIPKVDVLIAGHHGSSSSTGDELLDAVSPEVVCISVGKDNSYGHPAAETLQRLEAHGCTVYRTDESGTITIRR